MNKIIRFAAALMLYPILLAFIVVILVESVTGWKILPEDF